MSQDQSSAKVRNAFCPKVDLLARASYVRENRKEAENKTKGISNRKVRTTQDQDGFVRLAVLDMLFLKWRIRLDGPAFYF